MSNFKQIFADATARFRNGELYAGAGSLTIWGDVFAAMRAGLKDASPEQCQQFMNAISQAIDNAADKQLTHDERVALHDVLSSAFDRMPRAFPIGLAPKANFLRHVSFPI
jgi:hypothetical protein